MNAEYQRLKAKASAFRQQVQELGGLRWSIGLFGSSCQSAWHGFVSVFIDESHDADHVLSQSAFEPVWQVLKALRVHDRRVADELDQPRLLTGRRSNSCGRISLPDNIHLDVPRLLLHDFEQAFYVRTVELTTDRPPLTIEQILAWADEHNATTGDWPCQKSGQVSGVDETWLGIDASLRRGQRGLHGGSSLARLLAAYRSHRNIMDLRPLTIKQILFWSDAYKEKSGVWPDVKSGKVPETGETWLGINAALWKGGRRLPSGSSLAKLLAEHRGHRNIKDLGPLTIKQILLWADAHNKRTGDWPNRKSGQVLDTDETWAGIGDALRGGGRRLPGGSSLAILFAKYRKVRNHMNLQPLNINEILSWADAHKKSTGGWPNQKSGKVAGTYETWAKIDSSLRAGVRGLPGGSSLAKLLAENRGVRNMQDLPPLTIKQILDWIDEYKAATGDWPSKQSGSVTCTDETWAGINTALNGGRRGLPGGLSLAKLLAENRGVRNVQDLLPLTTKQILMWADAYKKRTGDWPNQKSGRVTGTDETWLGINAALWKGGRGLPGDTSLAKLLAEHRGVKHRRDVQR